MLALLCCAALGLAEAPRELHPPLPGPPFSRFAVSLQSDAPPLARTAPAPAPGWREPAPLDVVFQLELAPAEDPWRVFGQEDPAPTPPAFEVSGEFENVMRLYRSAGPATSVVISTSERPCF